MLAFIRNPGKLCPVIIIQKIVGALYIIIIMNFIGFALGPAFKCFLLFLALFHACDGRDIQGAHLHIRFDPEKTRILCTDRDKPRSRQ